MDGLADDADGVVLADHEPSGHPSAAPAARPGRVDQAFEIPLPDAASRRRLFALYAKGLPLDNVNLESCVQRTEKAVRHRPRDAA